MTEIDRSGTWTEGMEIGSPEWIEASLKMDLIKSLVASGAAHSQLIDIFVEVQTEGEII